MIDNNIWKIFYLIVIGTTVLITSLLYASYNHIKDRHHSQIQHFTEIIHKTIDADFSQKEIILDIIGKQLFKDANYKNEEKTKQILDSLLEQNPYFTALGLADVNGNILISTSNVKIKHKKNLLKDKITSNGFKKSLISKDMIIGRTYFFKSVNEWIIPLRKSIRDKNGNVLGVMIASLKNNKNSNYLDDLKLSKNKVVAIVKDFDDENKMYRQYYSSTEDTTHEYLYNVAVSSTVLNTANEQLKNKYNFSMDELRVNAQTVSIESVDSFKKEKIAGIKYDEKYNLWILIQANQSDVWSAFVNIL